MSKKKILFLTRTLNYGGAERQLVSLAQGLHKNGLYVRVVVLYPEIPLAKELFSSGVPVTILNKRGRWDVIGFIWRLVRLVQCECPHIIYGFLPVPNLLTIILKFFFRRTIMVWGIRASNLDMSFYDWLGRLIFKIQCIFSRFSNLIIVNSNAGFDYHLKHGFPKTKMVVIPNGIDTNRFKPNIKERERVRAAWGIKEHEKLIGLVARLDPMKDHITFVSAAAILAKERKDVKFVCIGSGPETYKSKIKNISRKLGLERKLVWEDSRIDIQFIYNALDIATSSSFGEGFSNVLGEAMACGTPCVGTDVGDSAWIIGKTGVVVPPKNPNALLEGWKILLTLPMQKLAHLSEDARRRIIENFSVSKMIQTTEQVFTKCLSKK
ncbi:MAG: glycosyltransferase [Candidatus Scalindua sp.]|nr:glycosyltransferase [Candidatus Scalindua sp.]